MDRKLSIEYQLDGKRGLIKLLLIPLLFLCGCKKNDELLIGGWNVWEVFYDNEEISGINKSGGSYVLGTMTFHKNSWLLPINSESSLTAKFKLFEEDGVNEIEVFHSQDSRFVGKFQYKIALIKEFNKGKNKVYGLEIWSERLYIYMRRKQ